MPAIGERGKAPVRVRVKAKPHTNPPKTFRSANSVPEPKRAPAPTRPSATQRAQAQEQTYKSQGKAVAKRAKEQPREAKERQAAAREKYFSNNPVKQLHSSEQRAISAFAELRASDPERYDKKLREAKDRHILGVNVEKPVRSANEAVLRGAAKFREDLSGSSTMMGPRHTRANTEGLGGAKALTDALDLAANTPTSTYLSADAALKAAKGNTAPAKKLWRDYKKTSAIPAAVSGNFKEAAKRASDHPVATGLELSGARAVVGRVGGAAARHAPSARVRQAGSTKGRPNLKLTEHEGGPEIQRDYSRDIIEKAGQVASDKLAARRARRHGTKPHVEQATRLKPALPRRLGGAEAPGEGVRPRLVRRVDTRVFSQDRVSQARKAAVEREAHKITKRKALLGKRRPTAADVRAIRERIRAARPGAKRPTAKTVSPSQAAAAGVQLVGEGVARIGKVRRDLNVRRLDLAKQRPTLKDPLRLKLNREEAKHIREMLNLSDENLARVVEGSQKLAKQQAPVQARGHRAGSWTETGQSKRFYPTLQTHIRRPKGEERAALTDAEARVAAKSLQKRWRRGQELPKGARVAAANAERRFEQQARLKMQSGGALSSMVANGALRKMPVRPGLPKPVKRSDFEPYVKSIKRRQAVPSRKLNQEELETAAKTLQRRARRGKAGLSGQVEGGPVLITQRPGRLRAGARLQPGAPFEPGKERSGRALEEGSREVGRGAIQRQAVSSEAEVTAAEGHQLLDREFGVSAGSGSRRYAGTRDEALAKARELTLDPETGELKRGATPLVPVNIAQFQTFGARLRAKQAQGMPHSYAKINDMERQALSDAWAAAMEESGRGKWVLMPEPVVQRLREHMSVGNFGPMHSLSNIFKDVVLTTSSPARWIGGNVTDLGTRSLLAGITPADIVRGRMIVRSAAQRGLQGEQAAAAVSGGGLYHASEALSQAMRPRGMMENPARTALSAPWRAWKGAVYTLEHSLEELPQWGAVGKSMRRETGRSVPVREKDWGKEDAAMKRDLKSLLKLHDAQIDNYANKLATDRAFEARIQKNVEDVIGRWGKVSPNMKRALLVAPFVQWLGAALRYTFITLPAKHPIKTGIVAGISEMTEDERKKLGLSYFLPRDKQVQDYQMGTLPLDVGHNKYGAIVKGVRTARMTSLGTAAGFPGNIGEFLFPQMAGPLNAWAGQAFTGDQLTYPDWWPDASKRRLPIPPDERVKIGLGMLLEATAPFGSAFRRAILEKGRPAEPYSSLLTPATRKKWDKEHERYVESEGTKLGGILEWLTPFAPKQRLYTYGAGKAIEEQGITGETLDKWRKAKQKPKGDWDFGAPAPDAKKKTNDDDWDFSK